LGKVSEIPAMGLHLNWDGSIRRRGKFQLSPIHSKLMCLINELGQTYFDFQSGLLVLNEKPRVML
jgi:hypothetical protein